MRLPLDRPLSPGPRALLAIGVGLLAAVRALAVPGAGGRDFWQVWYGARAVLEGRNPYAEICPGCVFDWTHFYYPLTASVAALPLAPLPRDLAAAVFIAFGMAAFTWVLSTRGTGVLVGLLSASVVYGTELGQWAPLFAASSALPWLALVYAAKPTTAAALWVAWPRWQAVAGGAVLLVVSLALMPDWIAAWRGALATTARAPGEAGIPYVAPIVSPLAWLLPLALLRWRRPEARLLVALACVPQSGMLYEVILLLLIPRTWREAAVLTAGTWVVVALAVGPLSGRSLIDWQFAAAHAIVACCYLPCLVMVLRRPNEGVLPAWLERVVRRAPRWLRGQPSPEAA